MKVLYIGGTGQISFDCIHESVRVGHEVYVFNRGNNNAGLPASVNFITGDMFDDAAYGQLPGMNFDVVCQFRVFTPEEMKRDLAFFSGHVGQYVFISTASAYEKPVKHWRITEEVPLINPYLEYSQLKADCEKLLIAQSEMPYTIVRPSHTSRNKLIDIYGQGVTTAQRLLAGKAIVIPGNGESLWTITRAEAFAPPFVKLFGNKKAINDHFTLTSDNAYTWNAIYRSLATELGVDDPKFFYASTDTIIKYAPDLGPGLKGDKHNSVTFDNSKIKAVVGDYECKTTLDEFTRINLEATRESGQLDDPVDEKLNAIFDQIIADHT